MLFRSAREHFGFPVELNKDSEWYTERRQCASVKLEDDKLLMLTTFFLTKVNIKVFYCSKKLEVDKHMQQFLKSIQSTIYFSEGEQTLPQH